MRLLAACVVAATAILAAGVDVAHACSCAPPEPRSLLAQIDAAFVGRLESRRDLGNGRARFTFRVERSVKGRLGSTIDVESASNGAACGLETPVGARIGLFLERDGARWTSSLCWQVSAEDLLAATQPLPPPTGTGPVTLLLGSRFGAARTLALDGRGRTLAYGLGAGSVLQISVCPGKRRIAEAVQLDSGLAVAIRELPGLRLVRQRPLPSPAGASPTALRCEVADGSRLLVFHSSADRPSGARLERWTRARQTVLWRGTALSAALTEQAAYIASGSRGTTLLELRLGSRAPHTIGRIPPMATTLVADSGATQLAGISWAQGSRLSLLRVRLEPFEVVAKRLHEPGEVAWVDGRRLVFFGSGGRQARLYTRTLAVVSSFGWTAYRSVIVGSTAYGVAFDGLHRATLPSGPERVIQRLPSRLVNVIVPVPR